MPTDEYPKVYLYRRIVQAKQFIDNNYAGKIDLDNISDEAYFSKFHFIRLFKSIYGHTPHQYLIAVRISNAKKFFRSEKPVPEVCNSVGFESLSTFSGLFKRMVGVAPSVYLAKQKRLNAQVINTPMAFIPSCYAYQHGWNENSNFEEGQL